MKTLLPLPILILSAFFVWGEGLPTEFSTWTRAADGNTIEAKVVSISGEKAVFELKGGKQYTLDVSLFIAEDQTKLAALSKAARAALVAKIPSTPTNSRTLDSLTEEEYREAVTKLGYQWGQKDRLWVAAKGSADGSVITSVQINDDPDLQTGFQSVKIKFLHSDSLDPSEVYQLGKFFFTDEAKPDFAKWLTANLAPEDATGGAIHDRIVVVEIQASNVPEKKFTKITIVPNNVINSGALDMFRD